MTNKLKYYYREHYYLHKFSTSNALEKQLKYLNR